MKLFHIEYLSAFGTFGLYKLFYTSFVLPLVSMNKQMIIGVNSKTFQDKIQEAKTELKNH